MLQFTDKYKEVTEAVYELIQHSNNIPAESIINALPQYAENHIMRSLYILEQKSFIYSSKPGTTTVYNTTALFF